MSKMLRVSFCNPVSVVIANLCVLACLLWLGCQRVVMPQQRVQGGSGVTMGHCTGNAAGDGCCCVSLVSAGLVQGSAAFALDTDDGSQKANVTTLCMAISKGSKRHSFTLHAASQCILADSSNCCCNCKHCYWRDPLSAASQPQVHLTSSNCCRPTSFHSTFSPSDAPFRRPWLNFCSLACTP